MTMSKVQFAAFILLTASVVGIGVGWLPRCLSERDPPETHQQAAVVPVVVPQVVEQHDKSEEVKRLIASFRKELKAASVPHKPKQPEAKADKQPVVYQGKPASFWLAQFRDRDPKFRDEAIEPLASIAEVDRSVIPVLVEGLKDQHLFAEKIARYLDDLMDNRNPPAPETVATLLHCDLQLTTVLPLLKKIDPKGEATLPLVRIASQDKQFRIRTGFIRIAFDKDARLPIPLLVEALQEGRAQQTYYYPPGDKDDEYILCYQQMLAAWLLRQAGVAVPQAVPVLVETLRYAAESPEFYGRPKSFRPFEVVLKTTNQADWFAATLTVVDPQGDEAIPLLVKILKEKEEQNLEHRRNVVRALGHYGAKAKAAVPVLLDIVKTTGRPEASSTPLPTVLVARPVEKKVPSLQDVTADALNKIDPKAINTKEPATAESNTPAKKNKKK